MDNWEFWLDKPFRVVLVIVGAVVVSAVVRLLIRKITRGIARGTQSRIVRRFDHGQARWVQDSGIAAERQALRARTIGAVLSSVSSLVVWAIAILMVISELGFNIAPVLASAGIAGVALSFGAQSLVKDYLSGVFIVAEDQLGIGDSVDLGEAIGTVENVGLRVTQVRDVKGTLWHVRNGEILRVGNQSQGWARCVLDIPVPYDTNIDLIADMIAHEAQMVRDDPDIGPSIVEDPEVWGVENVTGENITLRLAVKTAPLRGPADPGHQPGHRAHRLGARDAGRCAHHLVPRAARADHRQPAHHPGVSAHRGRGQPHAGRAHPQPRRDRWRGHHVLRAPRGRLSTFSGASCSARS